MKNLHSVPTVPHQSLPEPVQQVRWRPEYLPGFPAPQSFLTILPLEHLQSNLVHKATNQVSILSLCFI